MTEPSSHQSADQAINQPVDQSARERALNTSCSFAVSAPAGSGKTGLLITFTRKAAAEMQTRILDALRHAESQLVEPENDYEKVTWHLAQAVLKRNQEKEWELFNCPNRLRITTIDSFCRSLSQQMPFESKLGDTPEILDNVESAYQIAARETLRLLDTQNDYQKDIIRLVKHFDNKLEKIEQLFIQLLSKRDQWLSVILETKNQRDALESILNEVIQEHFIQAQELLADHAGKNIRNDPSNSSPIKYCSGLTHLPSVEKNSTNEWLGISELLLTQKGELRKTPNKTIGFFAPSDKSLSKEQQNSAKAYKKRATELFDQCKTSPEYQQSLETTLYNLRFLPSPHYNDKQWELLDSLTHILIVLAQNLTIAFQQLAQSDYLAITLAALDALGEADEPSDLTLALDYKIQHILIDEFQENY